MKWYSKARRIIQEAGLTYPQVETSASWPPSTLNAALSRGTTIGIDKAMRLAKALNVSADWLFDEHQGWDQKPASSDSDPILLGYVQRNVSLIVQTLLWSTRSQRAREVMMICVLEINAALKCRATFSVNELDTLERAVGWAFDVMTSMRKEKKAWNSESLRSFKGYLMELSGGKYNGVFTKIDDQADDEQILPPEVHF